MAVAQNATIVRSIISTATTPSILYKPRRHRIPYISKKFLYKIT